MEASALTHCHKDETKQDEKPHDVRRLWQWHDKEESLRILSVALRCHFPFNPKRHHTSILISYCCQPDCVQPHQRCGGYAETEL